MRPILSPIGTTARSPTLSHGISPFTPLMATSTVNPTTAQDLLNDVMGLSRTSNGGDVLPHSESSAPQPQLLFGSGPPNRPGHSIWSTSLDDQSLQFAGGVSPTGHSGHPYSSHPRQFPGSLSQDMSSSIWSSSYPNASQNSQNNLVGALPTAPFAPQPYAMVAGGHQRIPSSSTTSQLFPNQKHGLPDAFGYSSPIAQQPIHRPDGQQAPVPTAYPNSQVAQNSGTDMYYGNGALQGYHSRHISLHNDPRVGQTFAPPPMSQVWGNVG